MTRHECNRLALLDEPLYNLDESINHTYFRAEHHDPGGRFAGSSAMAHSGSVIMLIRQWVRAIPRCPVKREALVNDGRYGSRAATGLT